jgi:hypothetical protein
MTCSYDPETHRYFISGKEVPSVTRILKCAGEVKADAPWYTVEARERGTKLHALTVEYDAGRLDDADLDVLDGIDPLVGGRLRAWIKFRREQSPELLESEQQLYDEEHGYAGTTDRILKLPRTGRVYVVDFKPQPADWHAIQLGAYARIRGLVDKAALYLKPNGTYKWTPYHDRPADGARFLKLRRDVGDHWKETV